MVRYKVGKHHIWLLGIAIVIGGQYFCWNAGLAAGFGSYLIATFLIGSAYFCLCLCLSELSSALPFAGGAYGLARCTLGYYPGFLIGLCEIIQYITYVATSAISLGYMVSVLNPAMFGYEPVVWLVFYVSSLLFHIRGGRVFWTFSCFLGVISFLILLMYCLGSLRWVNITRYAPMDGAWFVGGMPSFLKALPVACWFYVGVESLNLACNDTEDPRSGIPFAQLTCISILLGMSILVLFICSSIPPGSMSLQSNPIPLNEGFSLMFGIPWASATVLSIPATYATAYGFIYAYGKLFVAMSSSKLLPSGFGWRMEGSETPYAGLIAGSVLGYGICLLVFYVPWVGLQLFNICMLAAFMSYISQCLGYIQLQYKFRNLSREFRSPLGITGAVYCILVFSLGVVSIVGFQGDKQFALIVFVCVCFLSTVLYYGWSKNRQTFSEEERKILFVAHVVNFNMDKHRRTTTQRKKSGNGSDESGFSRGINSIASHFGTKKTSEADREKRSYRSNQVRPESSALEASVYAQPQLLPTSPAAAAVDPTIDAGGGTMSDATATAKIGQIHEDAVYEFTSDVDAGPHTVTEPPPAKSPVQSSLPSPQRLYGKGAGAGQGQGQGQGQGLAVIEEERERWGGWLHEHSSSLSRGEDSKYSENPELPLGEQPFDDGVQVFSLEDA